MRNLRSKACLAILCSLTLSVAIGAQKPSDSNSSQPSSPSTSNDNSTGTTTGAPKQPPCWQQAGISKDVMEQRKTLEEQAKTQIAAVCSDASLNTQQKRQKIKSIHQQTQQQLQALITADQQAALKSCQASRREANPGTAAGPHPGAGPCGETPSGSGQPPAGGAPQPKP